MKFFIHTLFYFKLLLINFMFRKTGVKVVRAKDLLIQPKKKPYSQRGYAAKYRGVVFSVVIILAKEDAVKTGISSMSSAMKFMGFGMHNRLIRWELNTSNKPAKCAYTTFDE